MLPMYRRVAKESPHGQGSVAMLEDLLPFWRGKLFVLVLLGFVATSWIITITLSAADATVHLLENPYVPDFLHGHEVAHHRRAAADPRRGVPARLQRGGRRRDPAGRGVPRAQRGHRRRRPGRGRSPPRRAGRRWTDALTAGGGGFGGLLGPAVLAFPLLVLGLSGLRDRGQHDAAGRRRRRRPPSSGCASRIRNTRKLLTTAALIMSVYLLATSFVTTVLIPADGVRAGRRGQRPGPGLPGPRAARRGVRHRLRHQQRPDPVVRRRLGDGRPDQHRARATCPSYGMAPEWGRAVRPVVLVYTAISIVITIAFGADVNAQAGAYATGILAMMVSGAVAVTISAARRRQRARHRRVRACSPWSCCTPWSRTSSRSPTASPSPAVFIAGIIVVSLISRVTRTTELRADRIEFDEPARRFVTDSIAHDGAAQPHRQPPPGRRRRRVRRRRSASSAA